MRDFDHAVARTSGPQPGQRQLLMARAQVLRAPATDIACSDDIVQSSRMETIISVAVGLATGVISGFASWWLLSRFWRPQLRVYNTIAKHRFPDDPPDQFRYHIRIRNLRKKEAVDLTVRIRLRMPHLIRQGTTEYVELAVENSPRIRSKPLLYRVRLDDAGPIRRARFGSFFGPFAQDFQQGDYVDLTCLLAHFPLAEVEVSVLCSDSYTWARSAIVERTRDIRAGRFDDLNPSGHTGQLESAPGSGVQTD